MPIRQFQAQRIHAPREFKAISEQALCIEIGAGKGKHALLFSQNNPTQHLVAIERTREKFLAMKKQHELNPRDNLSTIHADAIAWMVHALYPEQVQQLFILYPNPEPHNPAQRWLNMPFFEFLLSRMAPNASMTLASNIPEYINEAQQQLDTVWQLPYRLEKISADSARTHFEVKYLARDELCQQLVVTKPEGYQTRFDDFMPLQGQVVHVDAARNTQEKSSEMATTA